MRRPRIADLVVFSRITGAALLVCGYLLAGLYLGRWCLRRGYPGWSMPACLIGGLAAALASGVREIKSVLAALQDRPRRDPER